MTKRLTAAEVARIIGDRAERCDPSTRIILRDCVDLVEQHLVPQWQAEPEGDDVYHVRNEGVCLVWHNGVQWMATSLGKNRSGGSFCLRGTQVCPIGGRPE